MLEVYNFSNPFNWGSPFPRCFCAQTRSQWLGLFFVLNVGQRCRPHNQAALNLQAYLGKKSINLRLKSKKATPNGVA